MLSKFLNYFILTPLFPFISHIRKKILFFPSFYFYFWLFLVLIILSHFPNMQFYSWSSTPYIFLVDVLCWFRSSSFFLSNTYLLFRFFTPCQLAWFHHIVRLHFIHSFRFTFFLVKELTIDPQKVEKRLLFYFFFVVIANFV